MPSSIDPMASFSDPVRYLSGVGPEMARRLAKLEIRTIRDLLFHIPRSYLDRRTVTPIAFLRPNEEASILGTLASVRLERRLRGRRDVAGVVQDGTGALRIVWFNQPFVERLLRPGERYFFSGSVQPFRGLEMHNPEFEPDEEGAEHRNLARVAPVYGLTEGITQRWLRARVADALRSLSATPDPVPPEWRRAQALPGLREALAQVHCPERPEDKIGRASCREREGYAAKAAWFDGFVLLLHR